MIVRKEVCKYVFLYLAFIVMIFIAYFRMRDEGGKVKKFLLDQGYQTKEIQVTEVEGESNAYQTSEPIDIGDGELVEYWEINYSGMSGFIYSVNPYPDRKLLEPIMVKLLFTKREYEALEKIADGKPVEDYIKEVILNFE